LMHDSGYSSYTNTTSTVTSSSTMADCPSGTVRSNDGTCMMSSTSHVIINQGYTPPTDYTPPTTYLPIRK
jgi:hypothetical protein